MRSAAPGQGGGLLAAIPLMVSLGACQLLLDDRRVASPGPDDAGAGTADASTRVLLPYRHGVGSVRALGAGRDHSCALLDTGQVRCWGFAAGYWPSAEEDSYLGDPAAPAARGFIDLDDTARQIAAGLFHTCALLESGKIRCWGSANWGALGPGD